MAGEFAPQALLNQVIVVLHRPQDSVNVGTILRAMKNMGISHVRLVQPEPLDRGVIVRVAHHCEDLLEQMTIYPTLDEALADTLYVVGTAALNHKARSQTREIRPLAQALTARLQVGKVALVFGQEDDGLDLAALDRCHLIVTLPTNEAYPALNLAQSVLLLLYEVRMAVLSGTVADAPPAPNATQAELERLLDLSEARLAEIDFFRDNPTLVMRKMRQIVYKAQLSPKEVALLMAILRRIERNS